MNVEQILLTLPLLSNSELRRIQNKIRRIKQCQKTKRVVQKKNLTIEQKIEMSLDDIIKCSNDYTICTSI